jgi:hypothetical protein
VREPKKRERFRLAFPTLLPIDLREPTKLISRVFSGWSSNAKFASRF